MAERGADFAGYAERVADARRLGARAPQPFAGGIRSVAGSVFRSLSFSNVEREE
jgi:hypothetical protein